MSPQARTKEPGLSFALGVSLILHLVVIGFAYRYSFGTGKPSEGNQDRPSIEIVFAERIPQQSPIQVEKLSEEQSEEPVDTEFSEQVLANSALTVIPEQPVIQDQDQLVTFSNERQEETEQEDEDIGGNEPSPFSERFSSIELNDSLGTYMQSYRQEINQNWMEECASFNKQNILAECPLGQEYVASLNPVTIQIIKPSEPPPLAPGEFSARDSFEKMTEGDLFNPYLLSGEIRLFGTGGGIINDAFGFLANSIGITKPNVTLLISTELEDVNNIETVGVTDGYAEKKQNFVIRPAVFWAR